MQKHYYGLNHLHYLTKSTYRRAALYDSNRFRNQWVATLDELRRELGFKIVGYVLMPEDASASHSASHGASSCTLSGLAAEGLRYESLDREEGGRETVLHA